MKNSVVNFVKVFVCVIVIAIEACFIVNEVKDTTENTSHSVAVMTLPSVLQDVQFSNDKAYMLGKPVVFDEGCCMLLSAVFNNDAELPLIATMYTEYEDYVFMQLN